MSQYISTGSIASLVNQVASVAGTVQAATSDPAIGEVVCLATQLSRLSNGQDPGSPCKKTVITAADRDKGLGLGSALPAMRAFVWIRKNPALASLVGVTALGAFWFWGYASGRRSR